MTALKIATLALGVFAAPAAAESLSDTHHMRWAPTGKVPIVTYHPLKRCTTATQPVHLAGKMHYMAPNNAASNCRKQIADADQANKASTPRD